MSEVSVVKPMSVTPQAGVRLRLGRLSPMAPILLGFILLSALYGLLTPVFEGPDEQWHFAYSRYLIQYRHLPSPGDPAAALMAQEVTQPPLSYLVLSAATFWVDASDFPDAFPRNRHFPRVALPWVADNKNYFAHSVDEDFPFEGAALAVRIGRWVSVGLASLAVLATYLLGRELWPSDRRLALASALLLAATPTFLYIGGMFSNDPLAAGLAGLAVWMMARMIRRGPTRRRVALLGLLLGLAWITKTSTLLLLAPALLSVAWGWWGARAPTRGAPTDAGGDRAPTRGAPTDVVDVGAGLVPAQAGAPQAGAPTGLGETRAVIGLGLTLVVVAGLVAGWLYVRNWIEFQDPLGIRPHTLTAWAESKPPKPTEIFERLPRVWDTYWGAFGWGNHNFPDWVSTIHTNVARLAVLGLVWEAWVFARRPGRRFPWDWLRSPDLGIGLVLVATVLLTVAALIRWNMIVEAPRGRLLFPAATAISTLLVAGWSSLIRRIAGLFKVDNHDRPYLSPEKVGTSTPPSFAGKGAGGLGRHPTAGGGVILRRVGLVVAWAPLVFVVGLALAAPGWLIRPAYARPEMLDPSAAAAIDMNLDWYVGDVARLVSYHTEQNRLIAGQNFAINLCWEPLRRTPQPYSQFVQLVGENDRLVAGDRSYPARGAYPTSGWWVGQVFCDRVSFPIKTDEINPATPELFRVEVGFFMRDTGQRLPTRHRDGAPATTFIDKIKIAPVTPYIAQPSRITDYTLGEQARLLGYDMAPATARAGEVVNLTLYWQALVTPPADYQVFIHLIDATGQRITQYDGPPRQDAYPTSWWDPGETVPDPRLLKLPPDLPPGPYRLMIGWYRLDSGERLAVSGADPHDPTAILLPLDVGSR